MMNDTTFKTIMDLRTRQVSTIEEAFASREIAFGAAVETVPADESEATAWRAAQSAKIVARLRGKYDGNLGRQPDALDEHIEAMRDYEAWCSDSGVPAFPASEPIVVRYLLSLVPRGKMEQHHVSRRAFLIGKLHEETGHPPRHLGATAFNAYNRAIGFAKSRLKKTHRNIHEIPEMAPAKAAEMFADGVVPKRYHEIAA